MNNSYVKSKDVFRCPSNPNNSLKNAGDGFVQSYGANQNRGGTGCNGTTDGIGGPWGDSQRDGVSLSQFAAPATVIDVVESLADYNDYNVTYSAFQNSDRYLYAGHSSFSNVLFCDGHVKSMRPLATLDTASGGSGTVNMWTVDNSLFTTACNSRDDLNSAKAALTNAANFYK